MHKSVLLCLLALIISYAEPADAGSFEADVHSGYGQMKYKEATSAFGDDIVSEAVLDTVLVGTSIAYMFSGDSNIFGTLNVDWALGTADKESWTSNGQEVQVNDLEVLGQFYDFRLGFKKASGHFQYEIYLSSGWDGFRFVRHNFNSDENTFNGIVAEDFSLWKAGGGAAFKYKPDGWDMTARMGTFYYPDGAINNSSWGGHIFSTEGVSIDAEAGVEKVFSNNAGLYFGGRYKTVRLNESAVLDHDEENVIFPESRTELLMGIIKLSRYY